MQTHRTLLGLTILLALGACTENRVTEPDALSAAAPLFAAAPGGGRAIPDQFIVVLKEGSNPRAVAAVADVTPRYVYEHALSGFAARLNTGQLTALRNNPNVAYIEEDQAITLTATQNSATWGIDRTDQRALPLSGTYNYNQDGTNVHAYIIDTGLRYDHAEFSGRVGGGYDAVDGGSADDCNGHGPHVSGTVWGTTYGMAKKVTIHPVRVLDCNGSGTTSGVVAGMDWVTANRVKPAVANMSLGGGASTAMDDATNRMINAGVITVVAAGNDNANACNYSPARVAAAITVGATDKTDARASYSNYGSCLDIFGPGSSITSAWHTSSSATNTISGTSMATPHVAGAAALFLSQVTGATNAQTRDQLVYHATSGKVTNPGSGSPNKLLHSLFYIYTGSLSGTGVSQWKPSTSGYSANVSGPHIAKLTGPSGTDFDLYLQKYNGSAWADVASGTSSSSSESVTYNGSSGSYRWEAYSYSGSGSYTLTTTRP